VQTLKTELLDRAFKLFKRTIDIDRRNRSGPGYELSGWAETSSAIVSFARLANSRMRWIAKDDRGRHGQGRNLLHLSVTVQYGEPLVHIGKRRYAVCSSLEVWSHLAQSFLCIFQAQRVYRYQSSTCTLLSANTQNGSIDGQPRDEDPLHMLRVKPR
jgi:hypothetical protein